MKKNASASQAGFSLIEMAIVLVIIAILAGSILKGRSLVMQSYLRKMVHEITGIHTMVDSYTAAYGTLPVTGIDGKKAWRTLYVTYGAYRPDESGYPTCPLGGHYYLVRRSCGEKAGVWLSVGKSISATMISPLLSGVQINSVRMALGYDKGDPDFFSEYPEEEDDLSQAHKKYSFFIFLCD